MLIEEHKAIMKELNSDNIEASRKLELITKLSEDYTVTQAEITTTKTNLDTITKDRDHFAQLSQKLWLENSATLTDIKNNSTENNKPSETDHLAKRTFNDLMSKF